MCEVTNKNYQAMDTAQLLYRTILCNLQANDTLCLHNSARTSFIQISPPARNRFFHNKSSIVGFFFYVSSMLNVNNRTSRFDSIRVAIIKFVSLVWNPLVLEEKLERLSSSLLSNFNSEPKLVYLNYLRIQIYENLFSLVSESPSLKIVPYTVSDVLSISTKIQITKNTHFPD